MLYHLRNFLCVFILIFSNFVHAGVSSLWNSCDEQYKNAWAECSEKYHGKCRYLGEKFKPSCTPGDPSLINKWTKGEDDIDQNCAVEYQNAWARCNRDYYGKCKYLGPKYKPNCTLYK